jgi:hypothetical protein
MDQQTVTLMAALAAAGVSIVQLLLNSRFTLDREKQLIVWRKNVDRLTEMEELCGELVEDIGSYRSLDSIRDRVEPRFKELEMMAGRLARYPGVRQSARDLHNVLSRLLTDKLKDRDDRPTRSELEPAYLKVLGACDDALGVTSNEKRKHKT